MTQELKFIQFIGLLLLMLVAGFFWGTWFTLTWSMEDFDLSEFTHIDQVITANAIPPMRIIMSACILCLSLLAWFYPDKKSIGFYFCLSSFGLAVIVTLVTLLGPVTTNRSESSQMAQLITMNEFSGWQELQMQWKYFHTFRTFTSVASFGCLALSIVCLHPPTGDLFEQTKLASSDSNFKISPRLRDGQMAA